MGHLFSSNIYMFVLRDNPVSMADTLNTSSPGMDNNSVSHDEEPKKIRFVPLGKLVLLAVSKQRLNRT